MKRKRVIIADCSQKLLEGVRLLLETVFDSVVMVADIDSLLDAASGIGADLVVLDLSLGAKECNNVIEKLREAAPGIRILILSMHDDPAAFNKAVSEGADGLVLKRTAADELIPAVEKILSGGKFFSVIRSR